MVAGGGESAALRGQWRGGAEVNLSVNGIMADSFKTWQPFGEGAGGFRTLARDRRTLKGVHAFGLLRMTAWFFAGHCARIMQVAGS